MSSEWMPDGVSMTVRLLLRHRGFLHSSLRPQASTAARAAVASLRMREDCVSWQTLKSRLSLAPDGVVRGLQGSHRLRSSLQQREPDVAVRNACTHAV